MKRFMALGISALLCISAFAQQKHQINKLPQSKTKHPVQKVGLTKQQQFVMDMKTGKSPANHTGTDGDGRNLPLTKSGQLQSVDGHAVEFQVPSNPAISTVCSTPRPVINGETKDASCSYVVPCDNPANRDGTDFATVKYFQLVWHVMWNGGASSNIDQARIDALMAELNSDFASHNMVFCADPANFYEDPGNWDHDSGTEEVSLKTTYVTNPAQLINIYVVGTMSAGGYARFPYDPMGGTSNTGGIVLARGNCSVGTHTLAHEMGHTFGLEHTFAGVDERSTCSSCYEKVRNLNGSSNTTGIGTPLGGPYTDEGDREGDWCSDTNPHATNSYDCTSYNDPQQGCDAFQPANPPVNNHMSYSFCTTQFTDQQSRRMHCMVNTYLSAWTSYGGGVCGTLPPVADFVASPTTWNSPLVASFTDLSAPTSIIDSVEWIFDVGASGTVTCAGCTGANARWTQDLTAVTTASTPPAVTYTNVGLYTVSLTIYSSNGNDTETKVDYIEVLAPAGDCDTLTTQWETPTPTVITYGFGGGWITGVQDPVNSVAPTDPKGVYERYFTPSPGVTEIGAIRVGLGSLNDLDGDMTFQVVVYDDDGAGAPGAFLGGVGGLDPTALGVPGPGFYNEFWVPFLNPAVPTTGTFHVGVEIFPGDNTDTLVVMTSCLGPPGCPVAQGEADGSNHIWTTGFGYENLLTVYGADFDVDIIPMLGPWKPLPVITGFTETTVCDTTFVTIADTAFYSDPTNMTFNFSYDGAVMNFTTDPGTISRTYTSPGPDTVTIYAVNTCGRADTTSWVIPYSFMATPDADFAKDLPNPICAGSLVTFTANTSGYASYDWDFGDGTTIAGGNDVETHTYPTPGLYYTSLTTTDLSYAAVDTFYLENFESGWPAGYDRYDNDPWTPDPAVNPPFTGTNATAWLDLDADGNGDTEAVSTSWNGGAGEVADDWMLTTAIGPLPANQMLAWDAQASDPLFPDGYEVRISTTQLPANTTNYSTVLFSVGAENNFRTIRRADLSAYAGQTIYLAFRNNSDWMNLLYIDDIRIGTLGPGCTNTEMKLDYVEVVDCATTAPVADGVADVTSGCGPLTVTFTDNTSLVPDPPTSWLWNFGDGTFSTAQNPGAHVYTTPGNYFVSLETCNAGGCSTDNITITVVGLTEDPSFSYSSTTECQSGTDMTATVTGTLGGTFTSVPAGGISLNASSGLIDVSATTPGSYDITYTTSGGPCAATSTINITVNADQNAGFSYSAASYCQSDADPTPTITGTGGGTFTSAPAGLSINGTTGVIDNSASTPGAYTVTYTTPGPCAANSNVAVTIIVDDDPSFTLSSAAECQSGTDITATITGTGGGTFTAAPAGLSINATTGDIDVSASTPGAYTVTYTTSGTCPASSNVAVTINADENASFTLSSANECQSGTDVTATVTGTGGGTFTSAPAGLSINATTGDIDVSASAPGAYTVTYTTPGACSASSNQAITIVADEDPSYSYSSTTECQSGTDMTATITGTAGGTFTAAPAGLSINAGSGLIDVSASTAGVYNVTYTTPGTCSATSIIAVTINADDDPTFSYPAGTFCATGADPIATITGTGGGTFSSAPAGLVFISTSTGEIDVSASTLGSYTVTYTTAGVCPASSNFAVNITAAPDATFSYTGTPYCEGGGTATVTYGPGASGGTFSAVPAGLSLNTGTGDVDLNTSTPGTYTVTNDIAAAGGCAAASANTSITIDPQEDPTYTLSSTAECQGGTDITATITGTGGGTFTSAPAGLSLNGTTGDIDVSASTAGVYTVTYTTPGTCSDFMDIVVTITADEDASYSFSSTTECQSGTDITATITGTSGGTFTATPAGLSLNTTTGDIDVSASTAGVYNVTYTTPGTCSVSSVIAVTINADDDPTFSYSAGTYCISGTDPVPTITGTAGGTFTATGGLTINPTTGEVDLDVSGAGSYTVTYTTAGICPASSNAALTITTAPDATFSYTGSPYCENGGTASVTFGPGASGGVFSATPAGLSLNTSTGDVDLSLSTPGTYTVTNDIAASGGCSAATANTSITITPLDDAGFTYSATAYCQSDTDPTPTINTGGGTFSAAPAGLSINATTGDIDVSASTVGTYTVTYTTAGACPNSSNASITINADDDPTYTLSSTNECQSGTDITATVTGTAGGTFTAAPAGLSLNGTTGDIDVSASTAGVYTVTYTTGGVCPATLDIAVTIVADDDPTFSYSSSAYCQAAADPTPTITGTGGGTFTAAPAGLVINATTGEIDVSASTLGSYTVTYTTAGACPASMNVSVDITSIDDASFSYTAGTSYCVGGANPIPTVTGTTGGTYSATPAGMTIDASTGIIDLSATAAGVYNVMYTTGGVCSADSTITITINDTPVLTAHPDTTVCGTYTLPAITGTGLSGSESYYDGPGGTGIAYAAGSAITTTMLVYIYDANGSCTGETSFNVTVDSPPTTASAGADVTICDDVTSVTLNGNAATSGSGMWSVVSGTGSFVNAMDPATDVSGLSTGANEFMWTISSGSCPSSSDQVIITVESCDSTIAVTVPSGFTPGGGDNVNETWEITGLSSYPDCEVFIYNKWGSEIFTSTGYTEAWDGTYNGNPLPVGAYYYVIKLNDTNGTEPMKGTVTIIK